MCQIWRKKHLTCISVFIINPYLSIESNHYCTKSYFNISVSRPSTLYRTARNIANIDRPSFIAELSSVSEFSSVENANQLCDFLRTVLDKHAPPSLRKVITHSSSPWFESIIDELFIANEKGVKQRGNGGTQS